MEKRIKWPLIGVFLVATLCWIGYVSEAVSAPVPAGEKVYEVVSPLPESTVKQVPMAPRLDTLAGKTMCELWNYLFQGDITFPEIERVMSKQYPGIKFVPYSDLPDTHGRFVSETDLPTLLPKVLKERGCQAVISGNGG